MAILTEFAPAKVNLSLAVLGRRADGYHSLDSLVAFAGVGGPVVGGAFVQYLSWHWVFWINLPVGALALMLCWRALKRLPVHAGHPRIDYAGAAILVPGVVALLLVTSWGGVEFP